MKCCRYIIKIYIIIFICGISSVYAKDVRSDILALGMEMSQMRNMLEAYILIGAKIEYKNPTKQLKEGIIEYEALLLHMQKTYQNKSIQKSVLISNHAWKPVKNAMETALNDTSLQKMKEGAIFIHGNIRTVIKEMAHMKKILLDKSNFKNKEALNASIEIAASARRLSAHYMMDLWHLDDPSIQKHWNKGLKIYADSLEILKKSPFVDNHQFNLLLTHSIKLHKYFTRMGKKSKIFSILIDKKANIAYREAKKMTHIILQSQ